MLKYWLLKHTNQHRFFARNLKIIWNPRNNPRSPAGTAPRSAVTPRFLNRWFWHMYFTFHSSWYVKPHITRSNSEQAFQEISIKSVNNNHTVVEPVEPDFWDPVFPGSGFWRQIPNRLIKGFLLMYNNPMLLSYFNLKCNGKSKKCKMDMGLRRYHFAI